MKRVIVSSVSGYKDLGIYRSYTAKIEEFLEKARSCLTGNTQHNHDMMLHYLARAYDCSRILKSKLKKSCTDEEYSQFVTEYESYMTRISDIKAEWSRNISWSNLNGSEQYAVELAQRYMDQGDDLETAAHRACNDVGDANVEPEYENEDFYEEEADYDKVIKYLKGEID